jgi:hypothetical protein
MIQTDISGHPPIPLTQNMGFHPSIFSTVFWVLNFRGPFEALNDFFFGSTSPRIYFKIDARPNEMCFPQLDLSNELSYTPNDMLYYVDSLLQEP